MVPRAMIPLERTTFTSSGLAARPRGGACVARCAPCPERPAAGLARGGPGDARSRPAARPVTSPPVCPARGGGVLIALLRWLTLIRGPWTDATGFITSRCRIVRARHGVQVFRFRGGATILGPAAPD